MPKTDTPKDGVEGPLTAYIITVQWNGAEWRAMAWQANVSTLDDVVFARGAVGTGALALDNEAWQAGADALAAAMPEEEED